MANSNKKLSGGGDSRSQLYILALRYLSNMHSAINGGENHGIVPLGITIKFRGPHDVLVIFRRWVREIDEEQVHFESVYDLETLLAALQGGWDKPTWARDKYSKNNGG